MDEKYQELQKLIEAQKGQPGALMPVLQGAQNIFGCVPEDVQKIIADGLGVTLSDVYGVATFYAQFSLHPKGTYLISVCLGTACYVKGSQSILDKLAEVLQIPVGGTTPDGLFTLEPTRCLGACGLAPVMMINGEVYGRLKPDDVPGIIAKYRETAAEA
jgi:NADH:ubiquinone oxidoreductase subunit E